MMTPERFREMLAEVEGRFPRIWYVHEDPDDYEASIREEEPGRVRQSHSYVEIASTGQVSDDEDQLGTVLPEYLAACAPAVLRPILAAVWSDGFKANRTVGDTAAPNPWMAE
jgi:hypothetical protein